MSFLRLLQCKPDGEILFREPTSGNVPVYAILSHTWGDEEITYRDMQPGADMGRTVKKASWRKIQFCARQALADGFDFFWVDTCCIDKTNAVELSAAINSMFRWYQNAARCYVYLTDVSKPHNEDCETWAEAFRKSRWFTRGWTLQELLAPQSVVFFSQEGKQLGDKKSLDKQVHEVTGIAIEALQGVPLSQFSVEERTAWAANRNTTIEEDQVYCLLGLFNVYLTPIYGEGKRHAFRRLRDEFDRQSGVNTEGTSATLSLNSKCLIYKVKWNDKECECMQALRTSDYEEFKDRNPDRLRDTCQWALQHEKFQHWQESGSSSLLWVSADPGCGKSVLSKSLVDEDLKPMDTRATCYFFFKDDNEIQTNPATALSAVLHQLFSQRPALVKYAIKDYAADGNKLSQSFHKLWSILTTVVADPSTGEVICVLDALDECAEAGRYQLIDAISKYCQQERSEWSASRLKFLVTSRPYMDIERRFASLISSFPMIRLQGEQESEAISSEIDNVIKYRVSKLGSELKLSAVEESTLESELMGMTHRTYLWLTLVFDIIRKTISPTTRKLKAIISTLPSSVDEAYDALLSKIRGDEQPLARKLFHIIIAAPRPLTLAEMNVALNIEPHHQSFTDLDLETEDRFEASIRHISGLFVIVVDQNIYLIHHTAKAFLIANSLFDQGRAHKMMTKICLQYLIFSDLDVPLPKRSDGVIPASKCSFLDYAAVNWATHLQYTTAYRLEISKDYLESRLFWFLAPEKYSTRYRMWQRTTSRIHPAVRVFTFSPLCFAIRVGLETLVNMMLPELPDVNRHFEDGFTCLAAAACGNQVTMMKKLLELGAGIDLPTKDRKLTPLHLAAANACEEAAEFLLAAGASVHSRSSSGTTPFYRAARGGSTRILRLLHERGSEVDALTWDAWTPLMEAVENCHEGAVRLLLGWGANPTHCSLQGSTPLDMARHHAQRDIYDMFDAAAKDFPEDPLSLRNISCVNTPELHGGIDDDPDSDSEWVRLIY